MPDGYLRDALARKDLDRKTKALLVLASCSAKPCTVKALVTLASNNGCREMARWNLSAVLGRAKPLAVSSTTGWELTGPGREFLEAQSLLPRTDPLELNAIETLKNALANVTDPGRKAFIDEAMRCYQHKLYRAAVVLSWVGAVSVLYNYVIANCLPAFNAEAKRRDAKWRDAVTSDDLARMKEHDFLDTINALSKLGKNSKRELLNCLDLRNGCGHPNSLDVGAARVASHIETIAQNVFTKFL